MKFLLNNVSNKSGEGQPSPGDLRLKPGDMEPGPNGEEPGLSFGKNPRPDGPNVTTTVGQLVEKGFRVWNDVGDHVAVTVEHMEEWLADRGGEAAQALRDAVSKLE